ncbi:MAG: arginine repressor [Clostridia bacterium]|nr:arginine repressor [Clostridia bacterium]
MTKKERLDLILDIISQNEVCTQEELTELLVSKGYNVSQSTISRDLSELNLIKTEGVNKRYKYTKPSVSDGSLTPQIVNLFKQVTVSMACANNLIVVKTLAGNASSAGMAVDEMHFSQVLGTIAGDDTLLIVAKSNSDAEYIIKSLRML